MQEILKDNEVKMKIIRVCPKCAVRNVLNNESFKMIDCLTQDNDYRRIMSFTCIRCHSDIVVQIDSKQTLSLLEKCKRLIYLGNEEKYNKRAKKLRKERKRLKEISRGQNFYDKNKNIIIKGLTFLEDDVKIDSEM